MRGCGLARTFWRVRTPGSRDWEVRHDSRGRFRPRGGGGALIISPNFISQSGASAAALGGLDTLVFSGGIGENAPTVRARICEGLGFLGIELEAKRNAANEGGISAAASRVAVRVIPTDEELMIARAVYRVLGLGSNTKEI